MMRIRGWFGVFGFGASTLLAVPGPAAAGPASARDPAAFAVMPPLVLVQTQPRQATPAPQPRQQSAAGRQREAAFRAALMGYARRHQFSGGIFHGPLQSWRNSPSAPSGGGSGCGHYTNPAACNAYRHGQHWAADRLQNNRSSGSERAWWGR
jgi:hypothetical protein